MGTRKNQGPAAGEGITHGVHEDLQHLLVPLAELSVDKRNSRKHGERNLEAIKASLERFGQRTPIVVQREGMMIRAGHGRVHAATKLGWTHVAAVVVDEADAEAAAFAIADNRSSDLAEWDWEQAAGTMKELIEQQIPVIGFTDEEMRNLVNADWDPPEVDDDEEDEEDEEKPVTVRFTPTQVERMKEQLGIEKLTASAILKALP